MDIHVSNNSRLWWISRQHRCWVHHLSLHYVRWFFRVLRCSLADVSAFGTRLWLLDVFEWEANSLWTLAVPTWKVKRALQSKPSTAHKSTQKSWGCVPLWFQHDYWRIWNVQALEYIAVNENCEPIFQRLHPKIQSILWRVRARLCQRSCCQLVRSILQNGR